MQLIPCDLIALSLLALILPSHLTLTARIFHPSKPNNGLGTRIDPSQCAWNPHWIGDGIDEEDCSSALDELRIYDKQPRKGKKYEFLSPGVEGWSDEPKIMTPIRFEWGQLRFQHHRWSQDALTDDSSRELCSDDRHAGHLRPRHTTWRTRLLAEIPIWHWRFWRVLWGCWENCRWMCKKVISGGWVGLGWWVSASQWLWNFGNLS